MVVEPTPGLPRSGGPEWALGMRDAAPGTVAW